jgi:hypothetical protein
MDFDKHIFISYAHIDNQPLTAEQQGWITRFHESLNALLSMRLGRKAEIWRDEKLQGNDMFADEITEQFSKTAIMVSVLTPRYVESEWCTREIGEFCQQAEQRGGVVVDNKSRVLKVLKTPVDSPDSLPPAVKDVLGYEFFAMEDGAPLELDPAYGDQFAQDYNRKIGKLAWDAAQLLKKLETEAGAGKEPGGEPASAKATVYLAECSHDRRDAREMLEADLRLHGYAVLPERRLPLDEEAGYVEAAKPLLARSCLSIHLVGSHYGAVPDGPSQKSTTVLQNELAVELCRRGGLQRVIWLPSSTDSEQARQQAFIQALHQDAEVQFGADLITGDIEELKTAIHGTLRSLEKPDPPAQEVQTAEAGDTRLVYLVCVEKDRKATIPLRKTLKREGFEVALPAFEGDAAAVRGANQKLLSACDAIIVFYGAGDEAWKRTIDNELKKMPGYRGGKPLLARYTYLAEPKTGDKEDLIDMEESGLIDGLGGFDEAALAEFVQTVNTAGDSS